MTHHEEPTAGKTALRTIDKILNLVTGPFFAPLAFIVGGAGIGGYINMDMGGSIMSGAIYGAVFGFVAWLAVTLYSWFS